VKLAIGSLAAFNGWYIAGNDAENITKDATGKHSEKELIDGRSRARLNAKL
jgi:hypothetical protein